MNLNWKVIDKCTQSVEGKESMFKIGDRTKSAKIKGVPHVTVNGVKNNAAIVNFTKEVCKAYKGTEKISVC